MPYRRLDAVRYAKQWAFKRNPAYLDFHTLGGDCTNFVSQCLLAGGAPMNWTPDVGWYYATAHNRAPAWTGVEQLYAFLTRNKGAGPYASDVPLSAVLAGDIVQLGHAGRRYTHAALIVGVERGELYVAAHTDDAWMRPLSSYAQANRRYLRIDGLR